MFPTIMFLYLKLQRAEARHLRASWAAEAIKTTLVQSTNQTPSTEKAPGGARTVAEGVGEFLGEIKGTCADSELQSAEQKPGNACCERKRCSWEAAPGGAGAPGGGNSRTHFITHPVPTEATRHLSIHLHGILSHLLTN